MKNNITFWLETNNELVKRMHEWRDGYVCKHNCWEWKKWKFCSHLSQARGKRFRKEIDEQIFALIRISELKAVVVPSQSLILP